MAFAIWNTLVSIVHKHEKFERIWAQCSVDIHTVTGVLLRFIKKTTHSFNYHELYLFLDWGRKIESPEKTDTQTGRLQFLHRESRFKPRTLDFEMAGGRTKFMLTVNQLVIALTNSWFPVNGCSCSGSQKTQWMEVRAWAMEETINKCLHVIINGRGLWGVRWTSKCGPVTSNTRWTGWRLRSDIVATAICQVGQ